MNTDGRRQNVRGYFLKPVSNMGEPRPWEPEALSHICVYLCPSVVGYFFVFNLAVARKCSKNR